jgi:hypothetical protein
MSGVIDVVRAESPEVVRISRLCLWFANAEAVVQKRGATWRASGSTADYTCPDAKSGGFAVHAGTADQIRDGLSMAYARVGVDLRRA